MIRKLEKAGTGGEKVGPPGFKEMSGPCIQSKKGTPMFAKSRKGLWKKKIRKGPRVSPNSNSAAHSSTPLIFCWGYILRLPVDA